MTELEMEPQTDEILHAIADHQRRIVLRELAGIPRSSDHDRPEPADESSIVVSVDALEGAIGRARARRDADFRSSSDIAIKLRHVHLPVLEDCGLVGYDPDRERVEYHSNEFVESILAFLERRRQSSRTR